MSQEHQFCCEQNVWIGRDYRTRPTKVLILGESTYGASDHIGDDVKAWVNGNRDYTFSRLYRAITGLPAAQAGLTTKQMFWENLAFCNFVPRPGNMDRKRARPRPQTCQIAKSRLKTVLAYLNPTVVWILGLGQGEFSQPVIKDAGVQFVLSKHPAAFGVRTCELERAWAAITAIMSGDSSTKSP
jgi:hypothetical protein